MDTKEPIEKIISEGLNISYISDVHSNLIAVSPVYSKDKSDVIGESREIIANHTPILKSMQTVDDGVTQTEKLVYEVWRRGQKMRDAEITLKDILSTTPNLKMGADCRIMLGRGNKGLYSDCLQAQCATGRRETIYTHTGYVTMNGKRVFLNGDYSVTENGLTNEYRVLMQGQGKTERYGFTNEKHPGRYQTLLEDLPKCAPDRLIYTGLAYTFLTPLNALLREIGQEPRFVLYFVGKTDSRKSSLANVFLSFFGVFRESEPAPISCTRDTINSMGQTLSLLDSTLAVADDVIPSTTKEIRCKTENVEQGLLRTIGDRAGRARLNASGQLMPMYRPNANVIITAEDAYNNIGESGIARSVACDIKPTDVNNAALQIVQNKICELNECMSEYIQYVIQNWDTLSGKLENLFIDLRSKARTDGHGRLANAAAHLQIGIVVVCEWLQSINQFTEQQSKDLEARTWNIFLSLAEEQNRRVYEEKPVKLFLNAINELVETTGLRLVSVNSNWSGSVDGYEDENYYYFYPGRVYSEVRQFYLKQDVTFPLSQSALFRQLSIDKLIEADKKQATKVKRVNGKGCRLLWLKKESLTEKGAEIQ